MTSKAADLADESWRPNQVIVDSVLERATNPEYESQYGFETRVSEALVLEVADADCRVRYEQAELRQVEAERNRARDMRIFDMANHSGRSREAWEGSREGRDFLQPHAIAGGKNGSMEHLTLDELYSLGRRMQLGDERAPASSVAPGNGRDMRESREVPMHFSNAGIAASSKAYRTMSTRVEELRGQQWRNAERDAKQAWRLQQCKAKAGEMRDDLHSLRADLLTGLEEVARMAKHVEASVLQMHNLSQAVPLKADMRMFCRVRPEAGPYCLSIPSSHTVEVRSMEAARSLLGMPILALQGGNACVLVAGGASSGKSHLLFGHRHAEDRLAHEEGMLTRVTADLFASIERLQAPASEHGSQGGLPRRPFTVAKAPVGHEVKLDSYGRTYVSDLLAVELATATECDRILSLIAKRRSPARFEGSKQPPYAGAGASTHHPKVHCVVTLLVESVDIPVDRMSGRPCPGLAKCGKLTFVDVASDECTDKTALQSPATSALQEVLAAYSRGSLAAPYSLSPLTYYLQ
eukprot:gene6391-7656_t